MTGLPEPMKISSPTLHVTIMFTLLVFAALLTMSFILKVEVVARGQGRVVPIGRIQIVQPEFAGRISTIEVQNGQTVEAGDVLISLDQTDAQASLSAIIAEQQRLSIEAARIAATTAILDTDLSASVISEAIAKHFQVSDNLTNHPYFDEQSALLDAEVKDLLASLQQIEARAEAIRRSEEVTLANAARVEAALEFQSERLETANKLLAQGATTRTSFLDIQQKFSELERERDVYLKEIEQKAAERVALNSEQYRTVTTMRTSLLERKSQIDFRQATLAEEERAAKRRVESTTLRAPVSGVVDTLSVHTIGGVAASGEEMLRIVPSGTFMEIEGVFSNQDIGFMAKGQQANIRLDAFPSERFGFVAGEVAKISADSTEVEKGQWGYIVQISPNSLFLDAGGEHYQIRPGMTATIDVITSERSLISYFFAPIVQTIQNSMGER